MTPDHPGAPLHEQARRARSFGDAAESYDRARPDYPPAVAAELGARPGLAVLDVGCGTGKAARLFAAQGCAVLGVEPDTRMADVARQSGIPVEVSSFEEWDDDGRRFPLIVSGQAWHWIDPERGTARAAALLAPGGRLAPFWNYRRQLPADVRAAFAPSYERHARELLDGSVARGVGSTGRRAIDAHVAALRHSGAFAEPAVRHYPWTRTYDAASWRDLVGTQSDHRLLGEERLERLLAEIHDVVERFGGRLEVHYDTVVVDAPLRS
jgi:SAM-dependent methyltransferase